MLEDVGVSVCENDSEKLGDSLNDLLEEPLNDPDKLCDAEGEKETEGLEKVDVRV